MVSLKLLTAVATVVCQRYMDVAAEIDRLVREDRTLNEFNDPPPPPLPQGFADGLPVTIHEDRFDVEDIRQIRAVDDPGDTNPATSGEGGDPWPEQRRQRLWWKTKGGSTYPVIVHYVVSVETEGAVFFVFSRMSRWDVWLRDTRSLPERQKLQQELRKLRRFIRAYRRDEAVGAIIDAERQQRLTRAVDRYYRIIGVPDLDAWRKSPKAKQEFWAYQAGERNALASVYWPRASQKERQERVRQFDLDLTLAPPHLGPIILSRRTSPEEIALKMALLTARKGILEETSANLQTALCDYLGIDTDRALEVFWQATPGYIGDFSEVSFKAYLRAIDRSLRKRPAVAGRIDDDGTADASPGSIDDDHEGAGMRRRKGVPANLAWSVDSDQEDDVTRRWAPAWVDGKPVLLTRIAREYVIPANVARYWVRTGVIPARRCKRRCEWTAQGDRVTGTIEVLAHDREQWVERCAEYLEMRQRKRDTTDTTPANKKRAFRRREGAVQQIKRYLLQNSQTGDSSGPRRSEQSTPPSGGKSRG